MARQCETCEVFNPGITVDPGRGDDGASDSSIRRILSSSLGPSALVMHTEWCGQPSQKEGKRPKLVARAAMKPDKIPSMPPKRHRTRGTGSIFLRGSVYWIEYQEKGRRLRESAQTTDRAEAERLLKTRIGEIASSGEVRPSKATVSDLCRLVLADYELRGLRDRDRIKWRTEAHLDRLVGSLPAARFGANQVRLYVQIRRDQEKASPGTVNRELAILHRAFTLGMHEEPPLVRRVPHIPKLEEADPRRGFIELPQYEILLAHLPARLKCCWCSATISAAGSASCANCDGTRSTSPRA